MITNQKDLRAAFWTTHESLEIKARKNKTFSKGQNSQICDIRYAWVDFVDYMAKDNQISQKLAHRATL